jgi:hypothetical protein
MTWELAQPMSATQQSRMPNSTLSLGDTRVCERASARWAVPGAAALCRAHRPSLCSSSTCAQEPASKTDSL